MTARVVSVPRDFTSPEGRNPTALHQAFHRGGHSVAPPGAAIVSGAVVKMGGEARHDVTLRAAWSATAAARQWVHERLAEIKDVGVVSVLAAIDTLRV